MSSNEAIVKNAEQEEKFPAELIDAMQSAVNTLRQRAPGDQDKDVCRILQHYLVRKIGSQFNVEIDYSSSVRDSKVRPTFTKLERILELIVSGKTVEAEEPRPLADLQKELLDSVHHLLQLSTDEQRQKIATVMQVLGKR